MTIQLLQSELKTCLVYKLKFCENVLNPFGMGNSKFYYFVRL